MPPRLGVRPSFISHAQANANGPYTTLVGGSVLFTRAGSSDAEGGDNYSSQWDPGDGGDPSGVLGSGAAGDWVYLCETAGSFQVTLTITDLTTDEVVTATATLMVVAPSVVDSVQVEPSVPITGGVGETWPLTAHVYDQYGNELFGRIVTWTKTVEGVVSLAPITGATTTVTAVGAGEAAVVAHCEGVDSADVLVTVLGAQAVTRIVVTPSSVAGLIGERPRLTAVAYDQYDNVMPNAVVYWTSTDEAVVPAPANGLIADLDLLTAGQSNLQAHAGSSAQQHATPTTLARVLGYGYNPPWGGSSLATPDLTTEPDYLYTAVVGNILTTGQPHATPTTISRRSNISAGVSSFANGTDFLPTGTDLYTVAVSSIDLDDTTPNIPTLSGCGVTWTQVATVARTTWGTSGIRITVFRAYGGTPTLGQVTAAFGGVVQDGIGIVVHKWAGVDPATQIVQAVTASADGSIQATLAALQSAENTVLAYCARATGGGGQMILGSGYTSLDPEQFDAEWVNEWGDLVDWAVLEMNGEYKVQGTTTPGYPVGDSIAAVLIALEIKATPVATPKVPTVSSPGITWVQQATQLVALGAGGAGPGAMRLTLFRAYLSGITAHTTRLALVEGSTIRQTWDVEEGTGFATTDLAVDAATIAAITDPANLRLRTTSMGEAGRTVLGLAKLWRGTGGGGGGGGGSESGGTGPVVADFGGQAQDSAMLHVQRWAGIDPATQIIQSAAATLLLGAGNSLSATLAALDSVDSTVAAWVLLKSGAGAQLVPSTGYSKTDTGVTAETNAYGDLTDWVIEYNAEYKSSDGTTTPGFSGLGLHPTVLLAAEIKPPPAEAEVNSNIVPVTVSPVMGTVDHIDVTPATPEGDVGDVITLTAVAKDASDNVVLGRIYGWTTDAPNIVEVPTHRIYPDRSEVDIRLLADGTATVFAWVGAISGSAEVTSHGLTVAVATLDISPAAITGTVGNSYNVTVTPRDANGNALTGRRVTFTVTPSGSPVLDVPAEGTS